MEVHAVKERTVDLVATPAANDVIVKWWDASTGGNLLHTGEQFTTPNLNQSTTYYIEGYEIQGGGTSNTYVLGKTTTPERNWATNTANWGINFEVYEDVTIDSLAIYPLGTGNVTVLVRDRNNNYDLVTQSTSFSVSGNGFTGDKVMLPVDLDLTIGDYLLGISYTGITNLGSQNIGTIGYPFTSSAMSLVSGSQGTNSSTMNVYYWFYDINISTGTTTEVLCTTSRIPVEANVTEIPEFDFDSYGLTCHNEFPLTITPNYSTNNISSYNWSNGSTSSSTTVNGGGTYSLTVSTADGCEYTESVTIEEDDRVTTAGSFTIEPIDLDNHIIKFAAFGAQNAVSYEWDFGDGQTGQGEEVEHTYSIGGEYTVSLTVIGYCNDEQISKGISLPGGVNIDELSKEYNLNIYPNPSSDFVQITLDEQYKMENIEIINIEGKPIENFRLNDNQYNMDIRHLAKGIYFLKITTNNKEQLTRKIVIQ